ncbi:hypothetical protein S83_063500 [Arachis hypogaea]|nr:uncharacterized protein DS421_18g625910 [Arachis hypogaea]
MEKSDSITLVEVESLLLRHEDMLEHFKKVEQGLIQSNFTQALYNDNRNSGRGFSGRRGRSTGRGYGRGGRFQNSPSSRISCQMYGKPGHSAISCFHRFNQ